MPTPERPLSPPTKIRFLQDSAYNDAGQVVKVINWIEPHDDSPGEVYYYDSMLRFCYLLLSDEGIVFERVKSRSHKQSKGDKV